MGSKDKMLSVIRYMFDREHDKEYLIDAFCGGLCVSAYAAEMTKFKVLANDLNKYVIALYREMLDNKSAELSKVWFNWVSRSEFIDVRDNPDKYPAWYVGYVSCIWSFGNNVKKGYLFGKNIEGIKHDAHDYLMQNGYEENQALRIKLIKQFKVDKAIKVIFELEHLQRLERLQQLERLERLKQFNLSLSCMDWYDFINSIPDDIMQKAFIYCDPPYHNTAKYSSNDMDYDKFWSWFRDCPYPVYVSSYTAPDDIIVLTSVKKHVLLSAKGNSNKATENLYFNGKGDYADTLHGILFN